MPSAPAACRSNPATDWTRLFNHFGAKAYRSKGRRTVALAGIIKIKEIKVTELAS